MATLAQRMVTALESALIQNVGILSVQVDGQTITFSSRDKMIDEYQFWQREAAKAGGKRPLFRGVDIGSGWGSCR